MRKDLGVKAYLYPQPTLVIATYNEDGSTNAMVAAWGSISDTNQVAIYVAHSHKTMPNILARKAFTVSMANEKNIKNIGFRNLPQGMSREMSLPRPVDIACVAFRLREGR